MPRPHAWLAVALCWWLWLCSSLCTASKKLDTCFLWCDLYTGCDDGSGSASGSGSGSGSGIGPNNIPPILFLQTATREPPRVRMNYAWSTHGFPTLFLSQSFDSRACNASLNVSLADYIRFQSFHSVNISGAGSNQSLAVVFRRLIEYNGGQHYKASNGFNPSEVDARNDTYFYKSTYLNESLDWDYDPDSFTFTGHIPNNSLSLKIRLFFPSRKETTRISQFPKTQYHQNSTVFDVVIHDYNYTLTKSKSRLALEMIVVNGNAVNKHSTDRTVTEDDEYTPSVFTTREYYFRDKHTPSRGFMQWKPVSYQSKSRQSTKSQQANIVFPRGNAVDMLGDTVPRSLASALFSDATPLNGTSLYIVIGDSGDDTYTNSRYMTWTAVVGFGRVPRETISFKVIIIIIVALGTPGLLILIGSVYVTIKKKPWQNVGRWIRRVRGPKGYEPLN